MAQYTSTTQKYHDAIRYFREHPEDIVRAWGDCLHHPHGCLFAYCSPTGRAGHITDAGYLGCPLMIAASDHYVAFTPALTEKIRGLGLPTCPLKLKDEHLIELAKLQREMDETIRTPEWVKEHLYTLYPESVEAWVSPCSRKKHPTEMIHDDNDSGPGKLAEGMANRRALPEYTVVGETQGSSGDGRSPTDPGSHNDTTPAGLYSGLAL